MNEYAIIIGIIALCFFWCAFRERSDGNQSDSRLLAGLGALSGLGGVGIFLAALQ